MLKIIDYVRCEEDSDGSITCNFEDWNMDYTGTTWTDKMETLLINGATEEEVEEKRKELLDVFFNWCEENSIEAIEV